jgi:regulator of sigma E protease
MIMAIIPFFLIISFLILVHELGHFFSARWLNIPVHELGIGFPPRILSFKKGSTTYSLNLFFIGGFVRLQGEEDPNITDGFANQNILKRALVISSGSLVNLVLPIILFTIIAAIPKQIIVGDIIVQDIALNSPANLSGLQIDDHIIAINGKRIETINDVSVTIFESMGNPTSIIVDRNGKIIEKSLSPRLLPPEGEGPIGIQIVIENPKTNVVQEPLWKAPLTGLNRMINTIRLISVEIGHWISGDSTPDLAGPIGIARLTGDVARAGIVPLLELTALLSLNLGIINLLPIPMLDGGKMFFIACEFARKGRRISPKRESQVHFIGLMLLMSIFIMISYNDILKLLSGEGAIR